MPHATTNDEDDDLLNKVLAGEAGLDLSGNIEERELELGDKADDAQDYGDIDDDDLADDLDGEDGPAVVQHTGVNGGQQAEDQGQDPFNDLDLFGEDGQSPPRAGDGDGDEPMLPWEEDEAPDATKPSISRIISVPQETLDPETLRKLQIQEELFRQSRHDLDHIPKPPENDEDLLASLWPKFRKESIPKWTDLFPAKKSQYAFKVPPRPPKTLHNTKLHLEIEQDDLKSFLLPFAGTFVTEVEIPQ